MTTVLNQVSSANSQQIDSGLENAEITSNRTEMETLRTGFTAITRLDELSQLVLARNFEDLPIDLSTATNVKMLPGVEEDILNTSLRDLMYKK